MRSQKGSMNPQFWANGYCTLASVGCSGNAAMCNVIPTGGDYKAHTACPPGTVLLEEKFFTAGLNFTLYFFSAAIDIVLASGGLRVDPRAS